MRRSRPKDRRGLSLVEVMIALTITAVLMAAVAQAMKASFDAFRINQSQAMLTMRARVVLMRIIDQVRASGEHMPLHITSQYTTSGTPIARRADGTGGDTGIIVTVPQGDGVTSIDFTYFWESASQELKMTRAVYNVTNPLSPVVLSTTTQSLLRGVTDFNVSMWPAKNPRSLPASTTYDIMTRAAIVMTVVETTPQQMGAPTSITVSGSAVPRQNAWTGDALRYSIDEMQKQEAKFN